MGRPTFRANQVKEISFLRVMSSAIPASALLRLTGGGIIGSTYTKHED
jgi:hypothetical protein